MITLYVYDNVLLEGNDSDYYAALIRTESFDSDGDALEWFNREFGHNEYSCSFNPPEKLWCDNQ